MRNLVLFLMFSTLVPTAPARADLRGGLPIGEVAPDILVTPLGGQPVLLSEYQGSRVMLLQIFKTTCRYCREEVPEVNEIHRQIDPTKVALLSVSLRETEDKVRQFIPSHGVQYPVGIDPAATLQRPFNIQAVPTYFILDRGRVVRYQGHTFTAAEILEKLGAL